MKRRYLQKAREVLVLKRNKQKFENKMYNNKKSF